MSYENKYYSVSPSSTNKQFHTFPGLWGHSASTSTSPQSTSRPSPISFPQSPSPSPPPPSPPSPSSTNRVRLGKCTIKLTKKVCVSIYNQRFNPNTYSCAIICFFCAHSVRLNPLCRNKQLLNFKLPEGTLPSGGIPFP